MTHYESCHCSPFGTSLSDSFGDALLYCTVYKPSTICPLTSALFPLAEVSITYSLTASIIISLFVSQLYYTQIQHSVGVVHTFAIRLHFVQSVQRSVYLSPSSSKCVSL